MISVCITTHRHNDAAWMLEQLLDSVVAQDYEDKEVIVSDDSRNDEIMDLCADYLHLLRLQWVRNSRPGKSSINMNNAINHAQGDIIKPIFGDDYFVESDSLTKMVAALDNDHYWAFATSTHSNDRSDFIPHPHRNVKELALGENTYGCPSAAIWKRTELRFDERLIWLMDVEFYARMFQRYGPPAFVDTRIGIREWGGQQSNTAASGQQRLIETEQVGYMYADVS